MNSKKRFDKSKKEENIPAKYYLYARKSTEDKERQVMSIEAQIYELEQFAKRENLQIVERFIESKSAKKPGREIFNKMMAKVYKSSEPVGLLSWHPFMSIAWVFSCSC